eukprot:UN09430
MDPSQSPTEAPFGPRPSAEPRPLIQVKMPVREHTRIFDDYETVSEANPSDGNDGTCRTAAGGVPPNYSVNGVTNQQCAQGCTDVGDDCIGYR